jgi:hypothetical protein
MVSPGQTAFPGDAVTNFAPGFANSGPTSPPSILYTQDSNLSDFTSNIGTCATFIQDSYGDKTLPYTPTAASLNSGLRSIGNGDSPPIVVRFPSQVSRIRVFPNIDHYGAAYDGFQYSISGSNDATTWAALFDATSVNGTSEPFTLGGFTGTPPLRVNNVLTPGAGPGGTVGYEADFSFSQPYQFYRFGSSTEAIGAGSPDQELSGVCTICTSSSASSSASNFNGTPIPSGDYIWFNANFTASGIPSSGATITLTNSAISFTANGVQYIFAVPNAQITFSSVTCATISFDTANNSWITTVPISGSDEIFLSGLAFLVPVGLPGGINPVTWTGTFRSSVPGITVNWKWGAAVYTRFPADYSSLGVKPTHSNSCAYPSNSDHAGTPEAFKSFVTGGARGGGGSNFTGSWSGTVSMPVCH